MQKYQNTSFENIYEEKILVFVNWDNSIEKKKSWIDSGVDEKSWIDSGSMWKSWIDSGIEEKVLNKLRHWKWSPDPIERRVELGEVWAPLNMETSFILPQFKEDKRLFETILSGAPDGRLENYVCVLTLMCQ